MEKRNFTRKTGIRDSQLIVIASEGTVTEPQYFEGLKSNFYNSKVQVHVIKRKKTSSSPEHIIDELNKFKKEYKLKKDDELWLVIDRDNWEIKSLTAVSKQCKQKGYGFAFSNPCFELWLLLHFEDLKKNDANKKYLEKRLKEKMQGYNKTKIKIKNFILGIEDAIIRAKKLDEKIKDKLKKGNSVTNLYLLVEKIKGIKLNDR